MSKKDEVRRDDKGRVLRSGESQRSGGRYMYQYTDISGRRRSVYSNRLEKKDKTPPGKRREPSLREKEAEIESNRQNGIYDFGGDYTVLELAEKYVATKTGVKDSTKQGYRTTLNLIAKEPFGKTRIDKVKISDAKLWLIKLQQQDGKHYSTIHNIRGVLRPAFQMAVEDDLIRKNPFGFELQEVLYNDSQKRHALMPKQEQEFLRFIQEDDHFCIYYDAIYILLNTGLRISEFCGLTPKEVDFKNHCIHVRGQLVRLSDMLLRYETTKTESGIRDVPMSPEVEECFRNLAANRPPVKYETMVDGHAGFYCLDQYDRPKVALHWQHYFRDIVKKYNSIYKIQLPHITPHVCRHTFCSKMARKGMNPKNLQYIMGHSEIAVTMDTYTELGFDDAMNDFNRVMGIESPKNKAKAFAVK